MKRGIPKRALAIILAFTMIFAVPMTGLADDAPSDDYYVSNGYPDGETNGNSNGSPTDICPNPTPDCDCTYGEYCDDCECDATKCDYDCECDYCDDYAKCDDDCTCEKCGDTDVNCENCTDDEKCGDCRDENGYDCEYCEDSGECCEKCETMCEEGYTCENCEVAYDCGECKDSGKCCEECEITCEYPAYCEVCEDDKGDDGHDECYYCKDTGCDACTPRDCFYCKDTGCDACTPRDCFYCKDTGCDACNNVGTSTGGVKFYYPRGNNGFEYEFRPQHGSTHHFGIDVTIKAENPSAVVYQWLRNGEPVEGASGTVTSLRRGDEVDFRLTLRNVNAIAHNGDWSLLVYVYVDGEIAYRDESRISTLTVRGGNQGGGNIIIVQPAPPPSVTVNVVVNVPAPPPPPPPTTTNVTIVTSTQVHMVIREKIRVSSSNNAGNVTVNNVITLELPRGTQRANLQTRTIDALITANTSLVITNQIVRVELPVPKLRELRGRTRGNNINVNININTSGSALVSAEITFTAGNYRITRLRQPFKVVTDISSVIPRGANPNRVVALLNGRKVGGRFNRSTGMFEVNVRAPGNLTIVYVRNLRRINVQIDTNVIIDVAGNATPTTMDVPPVKKNGQTMMPLRFMAYTLGAEIDWNEVTKEVTLKRGRQTKTFTVGQETAGMNVPSIIVENRTMVSLQFISTFFGAIVEWDEETRSIEITVSDDIPADPDHNGDAEIPTDILPDIGEDDSESEDNDENGDDNDSDEDEVYDDEDDQGEDNDGQ